MTDLLERLRKSKVIADKNQFDLGRELGKEWAFEHAEFDDLARLELVCNSPSCIEEIADVLCVCSDCLVGDIAPNFGSLSHSRQDS